MCRWPIFGEEELAALRTVLESGEWSHASPEGYIGRYEPEFERAFADFHTAKHGLCVANGTVALQLALEALDIGAGDEVIVPGLTWQATAAAVLDVNAVPILVDVEPDTYCLDPVAVEAAITPRTKAVIAVHLYNSLADLDRLAAICAKNDLQLIEDCAHSHGSAWNGRGIGSIGAIGCFSFQSTKSLTCGEGGFCMTSDDELRDRLDSLRDCGRRPARATANWTPVQSGNYRLSEWEAAILLTQFARFPDQLELRSRNARLLDDAFGGIDGIDPMRRRSEMTRHGLYAYVVRYDSETFGGLAATAFRSALTDELGISVGSTYEPLNQSPLYLPQTKRRYMLEGQWERIDPSRFDLPVATHAYEHEAVVIPHEVLLTPWERTFDAPRSGGADPTDRPAMRLGIFTVSYRERPLETLLPELAALGIEAIELGTGNYPGDDHCPPDRLLDDARAQAALLELVEENGMTISALSQQGNPLHPRRDIASSAHETWRKTVRLAAQLGVPVVNAFSGCPGDSGSSVHPNWVTSLGRPSSWTCWTGSGAGSYSLLGRARLASPPRSRSGSRNRDSPGLLLSTTRRRCSDQVRAGENVGVNFDPSHLFWQGIDPVEAIALLAQEGADPSCPRKGHRTARGDNQAKGRPRPHPLEHVDERSWSFRTIGLGHGPEVWEQLVGALADSDYDYVVSIEHEDERLDTTDAVAHSVEVLKTDSCPA